VEAASGFCVAFCAAGARLARWGFGATASLTISPVSGSTCVLTPISASSRDDRLVDHRGVGERDVAHLLDLGEPAENIPEGIAQRPGARPHLKHALWIGDPG